MMMSHIPNEAELDAFREQMDPMADRAAEAIFESHNIHGIHGILGFLAQNDSSVDMEVDGYRLPKPVRDYFKDESHFQFSIEDRAVLDAASEIFARHAPVIAFNLAVRSLCKQYAAAKSTNVLRMTALLTEYTDRRVTETFQFVLDVMQLGWYLPERRGIRSIQILRLIHALIRFRILHGMTDADQGAWNADWGMPINQEDMVFANNTFSVEVLAGLKEVGVHLTEEEEENYYQAWVLIGKALGVDASLQMANLQAAQSLQQKIYDRQFAPNDNGPELARALINWLIEVFPIEVDEDSIKVFIKFFNGEENYWVFNEILDVQLGSEHHHFHRHVHQELQGLTEEQSQHESLTRMSKAELKGATYSASARYHIVQSISLRLLKGIFAHKRGSKSTGFEIDDALANLWGLPGNDGIPKPDTPPLNVPKKKHPILEFLFSISTWFLDLYVKIRDFLRSDQSM